jgi:hypothetical protein
MIYHLCYGAVEWLILTMEMGKLYARIGPCVSSGSSVETLGRVNLVPAIQVKIGQ